MVEGGKAKLASTPGEKESCASKGKIFKSRAAVNKSAPEHAIVTSNIAISCNCEMPKNYIGKDICGFSYLEVQSHHSRLCLLTREGSKTLSWQ